MINLKFVGILAAFGFLLSFVLGLLGDVTFGYVILRAVISALVSGGTAALVSFVFRKFLSENAAEASAVRSSPSTGNIVDIRVDEEPLPDTDNSPDFFVSQAYSSASNDAFPYAQQAKQTAPAQAAEPVKPAPAAEFKAAPLGNVASSNAGPAPAPEKKPEPKAEPFVPKPLVQKEAPAAAEKAEPEVTRPAVSEKRSVSDELDSLAELPDIESMVSDSIESEPAVIEDSAFASEGVSSGITIPDISSGNDTTVIADAIRTLLKREG
jgi:hypothetical protein